MYLDKAVKIPENEKGISCKTIKGITYVYYVFGYKYDNKKHYTVPQTTSIGKRAVGEDGKMYPNQNFFRYFNAEELLENLPDRQRSSCLRVGTYLVLRQIIALCHLDEIIGQIIGKEESGLFLDIAAYTIVSENNAGQYYPDYAFNHPLFTDKMHVYSDTKVSDFINAITRDQSIQFQNVWNANADHREKIYISYDSTNKNCEAGDLEFVEVGHPKDDEDKPIVNYSIAYDKNNSKPLFYEAYPGSLVDVSQLQHTLKKAEGYGYKHVGFILDRGYFSQPNIRFMDKHGYDFVMMLKGNKKLVAEMIRKNRGTFEDHRECSIRDYRVSGTTIAGRLYPSDEKDRYFHLYYSDKKKAAEKEVLQERIDRMADVLKEREGTKFEPGSGFSQYFDLIYYHKGQEDEVFECAREKYDAINKEMDLCGYFVIITSEKMTAAEAIDLYKSRDASEKLFRDDKSYLGNRSFRIYSSESMHAKIFIEFVALIIRNQFHLMLKERMANTAKKYNYMTVPAAIRELEKIEMVHQPNGSYIMDHAVTSTEKEILKAFDMTEKTVGKQTQELSKMLDEIQKEELDGKKKDNA